MKTSRLLFSLFGGAAAFGGSMLLLWVMDRPGYEWAATMLKPGFLVADLVENATSSLELCVIAGFLTMTLIGALMGMMIDLLLSRSGAE